MNNHVNTEVNEFKPSEKYDFENGTNILDFVDHNNMNENQIGNCKFWLNAYHRVKRTAVPNCKGARIQVNRNWNLDLMDEWLEGYHDRKVIDFLRYGWPLNATNTEVNTTVPPNQKGVQLHEIKITKYIQKELGYGSIIGPFLKNPFGKDARFSPLDTRPKKDSDELRVIMNLSFPFENGPVNQSINKEIYVDDESMAMRYPGVEDLCKIIKRKSKHGKVKLMKKDLKRAYHQLWMDPSSISALGFSHLGRIYFDVSLSMGSKSAAYCCQRTSSAITYIFEKEGFEDINYLDDLGAAENEDEAERAFECLGRILSAIGIQEAHDKASPPSYMMVFLGILINTLMMTLEITHERRKELMQLLEAWSHKKSSTLREVQSLLGKLNFVCSTVRAGRVFITRIIEEIKSHPIRGRRRISKELKKDVEWWRRFMNMFNGVTIIPDPNWSRPDEVISTDASLKMCGGWSSPKFFKAAFPTWLLKRKDISINELELISFVISLRLWEKRLMNANILAYCDNKSSVDIVNGGKANNSFSQDCLREIVYLLARNNAALKLIYISSETNRIPDALSRWWMGEEQKSRFRTYTEGLDLHEEHVTEDMFKFTSNW